MADNIQRSRGRGQQYKFDRGGNPTEFGPFIGVVKNNVDPTRSGRLQVFIEAFTGGDPEDTSLWRTVSYIPPFYGVTPPAGSGQGPGTYLGNQQSYGMWFTPPDIGVQVICFFVNGDPTQGYYLGCVPEAGVNHMIPAVGAARKFQVDNQKQQEYFVGSATQLPVTEINTRNLEITENPRFFDQTKPVHSFVAAAMFQQGLITDNQRGPITSNSQRETPSSVFGISTPGRPIYQGGLQDSDIESQLDSARPEDLRVIGRRGGHTLVMDDGDLSGQDNLLRIRTAKGHQITMSDDGDFFYIVHANGQTWIELGSEGTVDVFATNSVNVRTQGDINLHADQDINMFAGRAIKMRSPSIQTEASKTMTITALEDMTLYAGKSVGVKSDGTLTLNSGSAGSWGSGGSLNLKGARLNLNGPAAGTVNTPGRITELKLPDVKFDEAVGWQVEDGKLVTIVTRAPTHEPYPYHNRGVLMSTTI
jgi:phage baseplate assembly protein gpV